MNFYIDYFTPPCRVFCPLHSECFTIIKQIIYIHAISNFIFEKGFTSKIWITFLPRQKMLRLYQWIDRRTNYNIYKNWRFLKFCLDTTLRQSLPIFDEIPPFFQCLSSSPIFPYLSPFVGSPPFPRSESRPTPSPLSVPMKP